MESSVCFILTKSTFHFLEAFNSTDIPINSNVYMVEKPMNNDKVIIYDVYRPAPYLDIRC